MKDFDLIITVIITMTLISVLAVIYSIFIKNIAKKNSERSEKILFEMKKVNDATNYKMLGTSEKNHSSESMMKNKKIIHKNEEKLDELIYNHHSQALAQSNIQFWFSLIAAVIGFVFIIITVCLIQTNVWYEYIVRILPGTIIEVVSVLFFSQSRETREHSSDFLNRLREDKQYEKGIEVAESISDEQLKSTLKAEIALRLCGIDDINIFQDRSNNQK